MTQVPRQPWRPSRSSASRDRRRFSPLGREARGPSDAASFQTAPPALTFLEATGCLCRSPGERRQRGGKASADGHHVTQLSARATWSRHPPPPIPAPPTPAQDLTIQAKAFEGSTPPAPVGTRAGKGGKRCLRRPAARCLPSRGWFSPLRRVRGLRKTSSAPSIAPAPAPPPHRLLEEQRKHCMPWKGSLILQVKPQGRARQLDGNI
ncbi:uncharacterized protein ACIBXB_002553 isoform 1-T2 [Morphnus guianensis]